jgi:hypothetical protein
VESKLCLLEPFLLQIRLHKLHHSFFIHNCPSSSSSSQNKTLQNPSLCSSKWTTLSLSLVLLLGRSFADFSLSRLADLGWRLGLWSINDGAQQDLSFGPGFVL